MVQDLGWAKWWPKINLGGSIEEMWLLNFLPKETLCGSKLPS